MNSSPFVRACLALLFAASVFSAAPADLIPSPSGIKADRPRLLLRPTDTPFAISLRQLKDLPRDREFQQMLQQLEGLKSHAAAQALVYHLTGKTEAAERAIAVLRAWQMPREKGKLDDPFHVYFTFLDVSLAYDWLHGYAGWDAEAKAAIRQKFQPFAEHAFRLGNDHVFHNYVWMFNGGAMLWALATAGDEAAADRLLAGMRERFNGQLFRAMEYLEGSNGDSAGYWWLYCQPAATLVLLATQSAFETDVIGTLRRDHGDWLQRQLDYLILSTQPDMRFIPWGDIVAGANGGVTHEMADKIDALTWALKSPSGMFLSRWLAEKRGPARFYGETAIFYFLYTRHLTVPPAAPPLAVLAGGKQGGHAIMRSDWSDEATVVGFRCTDYFGQHLHLDQGSFVIFRRGLLALDAGTYRHVNGPQAKTDAHNTLLFGGEGQRRQSYQSAATLDAFTQRLPKGLETGDIPFYRDAGDWTAVAGQFARAYSPDVIRSCVRQLLYIRPGTVVVVDQLAAPEGKTMPEVRWLLHVPGRPEITEHAVTAQNGHSHLRCRPLIPGGVQPQIEESYRTPAGPNSSGGNPAMTDASRVVFAYAGRPQLVLVHALEVGDGPPAAASAFQVAATAQAVRLSLAGQTYCFANESPFSVSLQSPGPRSAPR